MRTGEPTLATLNCRTVRQVLECASPFARERRQRPNRNRWNTGAFRGVAARSMDLVVRRAFWLGGMTLLIATAGFGPARTSAADATAPTKTTELTRHDHAAIDRAVTGY